MAGFGAIARRLEELVWRDSAVVGAAYALVLVGGTFAASLAVERRLGRLRSPAAAASVWVVLGGLSLERAARALASAVEAGDLELARALAPVLVGRDPHGLDAAELTRAAVESLAENTSDAVVAPLVWAGVLGLPGALAYRAANTLDAMVGHRGRRYARFGKTAARLDDVVSWPGARLTALLAIAAAPLVGGDRRAAWQAAWRDGRAHPSPNAGRVEGAFAGALGLQLGGTNRYAHGPEQRPRLGDGRAPEPADVERAIVLARIVGIGAVAVACVAAARRGS